MYLGSRIPAQTKDQLKHNKITHIINCAATICPNHFPDDFNYKTYFLYDGPHQDITCLFYEVIEYIDEVRKQNGRVYIHCHQGNFFCKTISNFRKLEF
jgi:hypothetical protein